MTTLYKPWGEVRYQSGTLPTQYTYTGQYSYTADFGLMDYVARWDDPVLGRFAQADTLVPTASQGTQAWDRFAYVNNNPIRYDDPSGHCIIICTAVLGAVVGAAVGVGLYAANVASSGQNFDVGQAFTAAGVGALAGALIGIGVGAAGAMSVGAAALTTSAGTGIAASGGGYMVANTVMGNDFQTQDFAVASIVGGASGAFGPLVATTVPSAIAFGAAANVVQYEVTSVANTGSLSFDYSTILGTAVMGGFGGAVAGPYTPASQWGNNAGSLQWDPIKFPNMIDQNIQQTFKANFNRTFLGGIISNAPDPIPD